MVIFAGSGCTGAIDKLVGILGLRIPSSLDDRYHLGDTIATEQRPVVFIGPFEHHSNELPWRESVADVVVIPQDADGHIDEDYLRRAVSALLNDLFGIQSRGGCSCAGPYGHRLLGIDLNRSHDFDREIAHGCEGIKPGWARCSRRPRPRPVSPSTTWSPRTSSTCAGSTCPLPVWPAPPCVTYPLG